MVAISLLATAFFGCGGDDSTTATGAANETSAANETAEAAGKGSAPDSEFTTPGGDNSVQRFGVEASQAERAAASAVLAAYLRAGEAGDREAQCRLLSAVALKSLEQLSGGCVDAIEVVTRDGAGGAIAMVGPVGSLRVEGERGYALYHGRGGVNYAIPMRREDGEWKVDFLAPVELP